MRIALLLPFSPSDPANSGTARLEMFTFFPDCQIDRYHFGPANGNDISIGTYYPEAGPKNFKAFACLYKSFKRNHQKKPYDLIWTTLPPIMMALFARMTAARLRIPLIVDVRDPGLASTVIVAPPGTTTYKIAHRLEKWLYKGADSICVTTPELGQLLEKEFAVDKGKVTVISNATLEKEASKTTLDKNNVRVFYAGTFAPYQPIGQVIDNLLADKPRTTFSFHFYGYSAEQNPELEEKLAQYEGKHSIHLHPRLPRQKLFDKLRESDIVLVPIELKAYKELYDYAVPLKFYEALAFSKPMVLFGGTAASSRILTESGAGLVCPAEAQLFPILENIVDNYGSYQKAASQAVFSREKESRKLLDIVTNLTS